jgi:hypothetical protein
MYESRVADSSEFWIRIRISVQNTNPDPDPSLKCSLVLNTNLQSLQRLKFCLKPRHYKPEDPKNEV